MSGETTPYPFKGGLQGWMSSALQMPYEAFLLQMHHVLVAASTKRGWCGTCVVPSFRGNWVMRLVLLQWSQCKGTGKILLLLPFRSTTIHIPCLFYIFCILACFMQSCRYSRYSNLNTFKRNLVHSSYFQGVVSFILRATCTFSKIKTSTWSSWHLPSHVVIFIWTTPLISKSLCWLAWPLICRNFHSPSSFPF